MSKYTTQVRFICEQKAGLGGSVGASDVDEVLSKSWNKIVTSNFAIFDEAYREKLVSKVLKHYYLREIGAETVGVWMLWMNTKFEEIMSYYNQLYESAKLKYEPFYDVDYVRKSVRDVGITESNKATGENSTDSSSTSVGHSSSVDSGTSSSENRDLYSDTPQGSLTGVESESYLTSARKISESDTSRNEGTSDSNDSVTGKSSGKSSSESSGKKDSNDVFDESVKGKMGGGSYSKMLIEYRDTFINIDMMIIDEFKDLFFNLW